jgi:hypothetical protein
MNDYPTMIATVGHVESVPRRIRACLAAEKVLDTTQALYVWEWPHDPQGYSPLTDVRRGLLPRLHRFKDMGMDRGLRWRRHGHPRVHPCHPARPLTAFPDTGEGASMCCDRRASQPSVRAER